MDTAWRPRAEPCGCASASPGVTRAQGGIVDATAPEAPGIEPAAIGAIGFVCHAVRIRGSGLCGHMPTLEPPVLEEPAGPATGPFAGAMLPAAATAAPMAPCEFDEAMPGFSPPMISALDKDVPRAGTKDGVTPALPSGRTGCAMQGKTDEARNAEASLPGVVPPVGATRRTPAEMPTAPDWYKRGAARTPATPGAGPTLRTPRLLWATPSRRTRCIGVEVSARYPV
mmetsp:Transcript_66739/g.186048  ORF Transcript_66739/g.186048 Transcript_66739/m.186048 type:complete len:227 (+) Transcript_66739:1889-2569(+)